MRRDRMEPGRFGFVPREMRIPWKYAENIGYRNEIQVPAPIPSKTSLRGGGAGGMGTGLGFDLAIGKGGCIVIRAGYNERDRGSPRHGEGEGRPSDECFWKRIQLIPLCPQPRRCRLRSCRGQIGRGYLFSECLRA